MIKFAALLLILGPFAPPPPPRTNKTHELKIVHIIATQNRLQFDTTTIRLDNRVKFEGSVKKNMIL